MQDRKEPLEQRELRTIELDEAFKDEVFPTRQREGCSTLEVIRNQEVVCYLCMDTPPGPITIIHVFIPPDQRSTEKIAVLKDLLYELVHPWCKNKGFTHILFTCDGDDLKTTALAESVGFNPENINMALMPVV